MKVVLCAMAGFSRIEAYSCKDELMIEGFSQRLKLELESQGLMISEVHTK